MSSKRFFIGIVLASLIGGLVVLGGMHLLQNNESNSDEGSLESSNVKLTNFIPTEERDYVVPEGLNFVHAAEIVTPGVVHIRSTYDGSGRTSDTRSGHPLEEYFKDFFGEDYNQQRRQFQGPRGSSGSGVIISPDGYIVTNNHVIDNADQIQVTLDDNRKYDAKLVGTDPNTDIALLKVDAQKLKYVPYGNSDFVKVGQWVLAVGNPFDLTSTVTAGIVSAKGRNINILQGQRKIEAFIQTDAAVNPGNSGGALVNLSGELVGINTAIATPTGTYAGYSFAVPVSLVKKVVDDLKEYGIVQRALLGVNIADLDNPALQDKNIKELNGVYVSRVGEGSAADDAGLEEGDIILEINDAKVKTVAELQEEVAQNRPGDRVKVTFNRDGNQKEVFATLKNVDNSTEAVKVNSLTTLAGAAFEDPSDTDLDKLSLEGGAKIAELESGKFKDKGIREGFIITRVDKQPVRNSKELVRLLRNKEGAVLIEGYYPNGRRAVYGVNW